MSKRIKLRGAKKTNSPKKVCYVIITGKGKLKKKLYRNQQLALESVSKFKKNPLRKFQSKFMKIRVSKFILRDPVKIKAMKESISGWIFRK